MTQQEQIKAALVHALHTHPEGAWSFIQNFKAFRDDLEQTEDWERELAIREVYKGPMPFAWSQWYDDTITSDEYENNYDWCGDIEELCLFIKNIDHYIEPTTVYPSTVQHI